MINSIPNRLKELQKYSVLKRKGYIIEKKNIPDDLLSHIKNELTVTPKVHKDYARNVQSFPIFFENKKRIYLPPYWALENIGKAAKNCVKNGIDFTSELKTIYPPRDYQEPIVKKVLKQPHFQKKINFSLAIYQNMLLLQMRKHIYTQNTWQKRKQFI